MSMDSIIEVFYHLNKMLIAIPNTLRIIILSFSKTAHWHTCMQHSPNLSISLFPTYHTTSQLSLVNCTDYKIYRVIQ